MVEEAVAPLGRRGGPRDLEAAGDRVLALAGVVGVAPAEALQLQRRTLGLRADVLLGVGRTVGLAEGVAAGDQRDGLLVVHRHPAERLADVAGRGDRVGCAVGALGVDVDQAHLDGGQRVLQVAVAAVALVAEPGLLGTPVDVLVGLPDVLAPAAEAEGLEAHRLQGDVAGQHHQVGPGQLLAVLLLDRPQQPAGLVEVAVVGPAVERREPLLSRAGAAAAVADPVGAGAVPRHPDHERPVVAEVRRPPVLRGGEHLLDVALDLREVERGELGGVVEAVAHRVGLGGVLGEDPQVEPGRPPALVAVAALDRVRRPLVRDRAAARVLRHVGVLTGPSADSTFMSPTAASCSWAMGQPFDLWLVRTGSGRCSAGGAQAPVGDLGLVDHEALVVGGRQARHLADGAVDVDDGAARAADEVVVVVADARLVAGHGAGRLDPADQPGVGERAQRVVDGLVGHARAACCGRPR